MRKSERIRALEIEVAQQQVQIQYLTTIISTIFDMIDKSENLESGKWYRNQSNNLNK